MDQIDLKYRDAQGQTLLNYAITEGGPEVLDRLLATGQVHDRLLLSVAASDGILQFVQAALDADGVDPNSKDFDGKTPL
jgi:ankyrin repeat protein